MVNYLLPLPQDTLVHVEDEKPVVSEMSVTVLATGRLTSRIF